MKTFQRRGLRITKAFHLLFVTLWLGGALGLLLIQYRVIPNSGDELYLKYRAMQVLDDWSIIPGAIGTLFVGVVYGLCTEFRFFKRGWLTLKWLLTVAQVVFGTFWLGPWLSQNVKLASMDRLSTHENPVFLYTQTIYSWGGVIQASLLIGMVLVSIWKPWNSLRRKTNGI